MASNAENVPIWLRHHGPWSWRATRPSDAQLTPLQRVWDLGQNGLHFADNSLTCIFVNENVEFRWKFHWSTCPFDNMPTLVQIMAWRQRRQVIIWTNGGPVYWRIYASIGLNESTPVMPKLEYSRKTGSIPWLMMVWFLTFPSHQQLWYWIYRINGSLSSKTTLRNYRKYTCALSFPLWIQHDGLTNNFFGIYRFYLISVPDDYMHPAHFHKSVYDKVCTWPVMLKSFFLQILHWRHNDHGGVSNHQPHGCLLNRLFRYRSKKTSKPRVTGLCAGNSPHKGPVTRKMVPFDDVIMEVHNSLVVFQKRCSKGLHLILVFTVKILGSIFLNCTHCLEYKWYENFWKSLLS